MLGFDIFGYSYHCPLVLSLYIHLLIKAVKCMEVQQLWQVGNEREENKTPVTKHLYQPEILSICRDIPCL